MSHDLAKISEVRQGGRRDLSMEDFAKFSKFSMFNMKEKWHAKIVIGSGAVSVEIDNWGKSPDDVIEQLNKDFWKFLEETNA